MEGANSRSKGKGSFFSGTSPPTFEKRQQFSMYLIVSIRFFRHWISQHVCSVMQKCIWTLRILLNVMKYTIYIENIFHVTGHLCGEFTGPSEFPTQRPVTRSFGVFFAGINGCVNNRKASDLRRHPAHYDVILMLLWAWTRYFSISRPRSEWVPWRLICKPWHRVACGLLYTQEG